MTPEQIDRLEAEADEALKQATATPETDKVEAAQEAEAQANADDIETQVVEPEESKADEPNADEEVAALWKPRNFASRTKPFRLS